MNQVHTPCEPKARRTITLDRDVDAALPEFALAQRTTVSQLLNRMAADAMGLRPRKLEQGGSAND